MKTTQLPKRRLKVRRVRIYEDQLNRIEKMRDETGIDIAKFLRTAIEHHLERCGKPFEVGKI